MFEEIVNRAKSLADLLAGRRRSRRVPAQAIRLAVWFAYLAAILGVIATVVTLAGRRSTS